MSNDYATEKDLIERVALVYATNILKTQYSSEKEGRLKVELKNRVKVIKCKELYKIWSAFGKYLKS